MGVMFHIPSDVICIKFHKNMQSLPHLHVVTSQQLLPLKQQTQLQEIICEKKLLLKQENKISFPY